MSKDKKNIVIKKIAVIILIFITAFLCSCLEVKLRLITTQKPQNNLYKEAISVNKNNAHAYFESGKIALEENKYNEAITSFKKATQIKRDFVEAWLGLGNTYLIIGRYSKAEDMFKKCLAIVPDYLNAKTGLGKVYIFTNRLNQAEEIFLSQIKADKNKIIAYESLGDIAYKKIEFSKAVSYWEKALEIIPQDSMIKNKCDKLKEYLNSYPENR